MRHLFPKNAVAEKRQRAYELTLFKESKKPVLTTPQGRDYVRLSTAQKLTLLLLLGFIGRAYGSPRVESSSPEKSRQLDFSLSDIDGPTFHGHPTKDISNLAMPCTRKTKGHSSGKICVINNKKFYLKDTNDSGQDSLVGAFNFKFAKNNMGINVPNTEFFYEQIWLGREKFYFASEAIDGFRSGSELMPRRGYFFYDYTAYRSTLASVLGEKDIAKLVVANTFIDDLNLDNWGYNHDGLVLVDVDMIENDFMSFKAASSRKISESSFIYGLFGVARPVITLSLDNIYEMKSIYYRMLDKPLPKSSGFNDTHYASFYFALLTGYIEACTSIIDNFSEKFPHLNCTTPSMEINQEFSDLLDLQILRGR